MGMPEVDPARVGATGGSQGGGLTLACAALEPRIKRGARSSRSCATTSASGRWTWPRTPTRSCATSSGMFDPLHEREEEIFTRLGYIDVQHLAPRISGEVLMGVGLMDTICPPSTQFAAYNKITLPRRAWSSTRTSATRACRASTTTPSSSWPGL